MFQAGRVEANNLTNPKLKLLQSSHDVSKISNSASKQDKAVPVKPIEIKKRHENLDGEESRAVAIGEMAANLMRMKSQSNRIDAEIAQISQARNDKVLKMNEEFKEELKKLEEEKRGGTWKESKSSRD